MRPSWAGICLTLACSCLKTHNNACCCVRTREDAGSGTSSRQVPMPLITCSHVQLSGFIHPRHPKEPSLPPSKSR